jgi:hypothetical protein
MSSPPFIFTNKVISKDAYIVKSPLFAKEGDITSLWQREVRWDFLNNVVILMALLVIK